MHGQPIIKNSHEVRKCLQAQHFGALVLLTPETLFSCNTLIYGSIFMPSSTLCAGNTSQLKTWELKINVTVRIAYLTFGLCPSSGVPKIQKRKNSVSETGSLPSATDGG
jgi:hypothetical protein